MAGSLTLTSGGLALLSQYLAASRNDLAPQPPQYIAFGSGTTPMGRFNTQIPGETYRQPISSRSRDGFRVTYGFFLNTADNQNQTIAVYGIFAGEATAQGGTGTLLAYAQEPSPFGKSSGNTFAGDLPLTLSGTLS